MSNAQPQFIAVGTGSEHRSIAVHVTAADPAASKAADPAASKAADPAASKTTTEKAKPGLVWLPGLKSDMASTKATAVAEFALAQGMAATRFDYSGHGQSGGRFEDGTIGRWLDEADAVLETLTRGPQILVGSSMGGYIALLLLKRRLATAVTHVNRIAGLVLIAPAWDMTEELMWLQFPASTRATIERDGVWLRPSEYGAPYPITRGLIEEGRAHLLARTTFRPGCPVHIVHGLIDPDVPWEHTMDLVSFLDGPDIEVTAVPEGEHRLSRPEDIALILDIISQTAEAAARAA